MSGPIAAVPVSELTSGVQLFRCVPYSCTMLARSCVVRQAQADSDFPPVSLLLCKGCALGAEVKARAGGDVDVDPHAAARASRKHITGLPQKAQRKPPVFAALPAASLPAAEPQVVTAPRVAPPPPKREERMPNFVDQTGKKIGGATVVGRAESTGKGASWRVKHACGHEAVITSALLTYYAKAGSALRCKEPECRAPLKSELARAKAPRVSAAAEAPSPRESAPRQKRPALAPVTLTSSTTHTHEFPLRRDFTARLELPSDLSKADVTRLSRWLDVIAFEAE